MKVLAVLDSLAPGGTERSTIVLAPRLRDLGVDIEIVTLRSDEHELTDEAADLGITLHRLRAGSFARRVRELRALIREAGPDLVHTALYRADQVGRIAAWGTGVPVVSSFVNTPYDPARLADPNVVRWKLRVAQLIDSVTGRLMVDRFHSVAAGTGEANARALKLPMSRITVAERGRDADALGVRSADRRRRVRRSLGLSQGADVVLNLGRLDHQKGQTVLIDAATQLVETHPHVVVLIAGKDGSASADVRDTLADSPAAAHVRLLGHRTDVGDLLCAADVLAISSHFEGTAGAAVEAMALETPIVSTDLTGVGGILEDGRNCVLVPVSDAAALAAGLARVLDDPSLAAHFAAAGRREFLERFTLDAAAGRLRDLYVSVAG